MIYHDLSLRNAKTITLVAYGVYLVEGVVGVERSLKANNLEGENLWSFGQVSVPVHYFIVKST